MGWTNDRAMAIRSTWESGRVSDLQFTDAVRDPIGHVAGVYDAIGLDLTAEAETAMRRWLTERPHETSKRPDYSPETYGLSEAMIRERFQEYDATYRHH